MDSTQTAKHSNCNCNKVREENIKRKDEIVAQYKASARPEDKKTLCRFYYRGICIFSAQDCKFAHGTEDLLFEKPSLEEFEKNNKEDEENKSSDEPKKEDEEEDEDEVENHEKNRVLQPVIKVELSYDTMVNYQEILVAKGYIESKYTRQDIWNKVKVRSQLRKAFRFYLAQELMDLFYRSYGTNMLRKDFAMKLYGMVGFNLKWKYLFDGKYAYDKKNRVIKYPSREEFEEWGKKCVIEIILTNKLIDKIPISPGLISKGFFKDMEEKYPYQPHLFTFLKAFNFPKIDNYLKALQNDPAFVERLGQNVGKSLTDVAFKLFDDPMAELEKLNTKISTLLKNLIQNSTIGFILLSRFENEVLNLCKKEYQYFFSNQHIVRKSLREILMNNKALTIPLDSDDYLFFVNKLKSLSLDKIITKYMDKLEINCFTSLKDEDLPKKEKPIFKEPEFPDLKEEGLKKFSEEDLAKEIDINKIVFVDNLSYLQYAIEYMENVTEIAVDIEGGLETGHVELIQIACKDKIFIFDVFTASKEMLDESQSNSRSEFYDVMADWVKKTMENPFICKVFHDSRKDSQGLHLYNHICPQNTFDTSAVHMLIEVLKIYVTNGFDLGLIPRLGADKAIYTMNQDNLAALMKSVEDISSPGLNEVLKTYGASHGENKLKEIMKHRFSTMPQSYFLKRPIDKEFLIYSARDVEDLCEVKENMKKILAELIFQLLGKQDIRKTDILCKKVSKTYCQFGCKHKFRKSKDT